MCSLGARVNAKDNKWLTPLHRAVASCSEVHSALHYHHRILISTTRASHSYLPHHTWSVPTGGRAGAAETFSGCQRPRQELADAAAHRRGQQGGPLCRGAGPPAQQCECFGPGRADGTAPRCLQRAPGGGPFVCFNLPPLA